MKFKYLQGGALSLPFAVYQPYIIPNDDGTVSTGGKKSSSSKSDGGIEMEELYKMFKDLQGLPGDVNSVIGTMNLLFGSIEHKLSNPAMFGGTSSITAEYMQLLGLANNLKFLRELYDKAYDTAVDKGSIHEAAINKYGLVMVLSEEGYGWITPEEYHNNRDLYHIVTNSELLDSRALGRGGLAFNSEALATVSEGMSVKEITDIINTTLTNLGKEAKSEEGYVKTKAGQLLLGLQDYIKAKENSGKYNASMEDLYLAGLLEEHLIKQARQALDYIYGAIPKTGISLLMLKTDGTGEGAKSMIDSLVFSKLSTKIDLKKLELKGGPTDTTSSNSKEYLEHTFVTEVQAGRGAYKGVFDLNNESNNKLSTDIDVYTGVKKLNGDYSTKTSIELALKDSGLLSITMGYGFLGKLKISEEQMLDLLYNGGAFARAELPIDKNSNSPKFDLLDKLDAFESEVKHLGEDPKKLLEGKYKELKMYFESDGRTRRKELFAPFLLFNVVTSEGLLKIEKDNNFVVDIASDSKTYSDIVHYLTAANPSNPNKYKDLDYKDWGELFTFGQYDHLYKGTLYIPMNMSKEAAMLGSNQTPKIGDDRFELLYQLSQKDYIPTDIASLKN